MMRIRFLMLLLVLQTTMVKGQPQEVKSQLLTPAEFETKMKVVKSYTLLDVRTQEEYDNGHLEGSTLLDFYDSNFKKQLSKLDKTKPVFVYCAVGGRSASTVTALTTMGFKEVYDLKGGIKRWSKEQLKVVK